MGGSATILDSDAPAVRSTATAYVRRLLRAAPRDQLRFLVPTDDGNPTAEYLCLVYTLDNASQTGTGDLPLEHVMERSRAVMEAVTGKGLDDATLQARLASLERWGVVEVGIETGSAISLTKWSASYKRYRISKEGEMVMRLLESALVRRQNATGIQEAQNNLAEMATALVNVATRIRDLDANRDLDLEERHSQWREAYIQLARIKETDHRGLLDYLRDLNQHIIHFGRDQSPTEDLIELLDRLEAYMASVHREFQHKGAAIAAACHDLFDPEILEALRLGKSLAEARDAEDPLMASRLRPEPEELVHHIQAFFEDDGPGTLAAEVSRIAENCSAIVSRLRDHWQRILDRSSNVQLIQQAWEQIMDLDWDDDEAWYRVAYWTHRVYDLKRLPTAPGLGDEAERGKPPTPRRRRTYRITQERIVPALRSQGEPDWKSERERELARRLNDFVEDRILQGRSEGRASDLDVDSLATFRHLVQAVQHSDLILSGPPAYYFTFTVKRHGAAPVEWPVSGAKYSAPELVFKAQTPRKRTNVEAIVHA